MAEPFGVRVLLRAFLLPRWLLVAGEAATFIGVPGEKFPGKKEEVET